MDPPNIQPCTFVEYDKLSFIDYIMYEDHFHVPKKFSDLKNILNLSPYPKPILSKLSNIRKWQ